MMLGGFLFAPAAEANKSSAMRATPNCLLVLQSAANRYSPFKVSAPELEEAVGSRIAGGLDLLNVREFKLLQNYESAMRWRKISRRDQEKSSIENAVFAYLQAEGVGFTVVVLPSKAKEFVISAGVGHPIGRFARWVQQEFDLRLVVNVSESLRDRKGWLPFHQQGAQVYNVTPKELLLIRRHFIE